MVRDGHLNCVNAKKVIFGRLPFSGRNIPSTGQQNHDAHEKLCRDRNRRISSIEKNI